MSSDLTTSSEFIVTSITPTLVLGPVFSSASLTNTLRPSNHTVPSCLDTTPTSTFASERRTSSRSPSAALSTILLSSASVLASTAPSSLSLSTTEVRSPTSDSPVVRAPNSTETTSKSTSESLSLTMSSTPHTTANADAPVDPPPTVPQSNSTSISGSSNQTSSENSTSSLAPRTSQSSESHTVTSNTPRSSTNLGNTNSLITSTTTSVVFAKGTNPSTTVVNTVTESPESTLKSAVGVVVTQTDGHTTLSFPPVVTVLSTSMLPNGSFVTFTHAVANPTGASQADGGSNSKGFLDNHGAVAGVFLAVGVILASLVGCVFFLIRRRRKQGSQSSTERWIEDMQRLPQVPRYLDDPFIDHPEMTAVDGGNRISTRSPDRFQLDDGGPLIPLTPTYPTAPVLVTSPIQRKQPPIDDGPFSDNNALDTNRERTEILNRLVSPLEVSRASSPSLYPPTDKDEYEDIDLDESRPPPQRRPVSDTSANASRPTSAEIQTTAPPRPPRSILRTPSKVYEPYTPPPSESNHSSSDSPTTPVSEKSFRAERQLRPVRPISTALGEDVYTRPTLLNVRPRSKGQL